MAMIKQMLDTHPTGAEGVDRDPLVACIEACLECVQACTVCADACLAADGVADLRRCITLNLDCADICAATAAILTRLTGADTGVRRAVLEACADVCRACGDECAAHRDAHEHCAVCADACRRCEQACRELAASLG